MKYKASLFNYYFDLGNGKTGIFNTLSGSLAGLESEKCMMIKNFSECSYDLEQEAINALISKGFIVPYVLNEYDMINSKRIQRIMNNKISFYRIVTTTDCNARCFYCYEGSAGHEYMNLETAEQTVKFILDHLEDRKCVIQWFGGEPLMNIPVIDLISEKLRSRLSDDKIRFVMMTNASLIDSEVIRKMKNLWNICILQITLDSPKDEYEKRKNYLSFSENLGLRIAQIPSLFDDFISELCQNLTRI